MSYKINKIKEIIEHTKMIKYNHIVLVGVVVAGGRNELLWNNCRIYMLRIRIRYQERLFTNTFQSIFEHTT